MAGQKPASLTETQARRYPRVILQRSLSEALSALAARVTWPNLETSDLIDLSYKGFAARRPGLFPIAVQARVNLRVELGTFAGFASEARIAWCNAEWVGLEIPVLSAEGHAAMAAYLDAKLLGSRLKPVERAFIGPQQTFQYWFQGPLDTHVFIWTDKEQLVQRVSVSLNGDSVEFERGQKIVSLRARERQALLVLSQMDKDTLPMEDFVRSLGAQSGA